jgi:hypothetical protein
MKRLILILNCLAIFYAGAVWALEGCSDLSVGSEAQHHSENGVPSHHDAGATSHHSHSDPSKVHCPNVFGEFLVSSRASVQSSNDYVYRTTFAAAFSHDLSPSVSSQGTDQGPPGSVHSKNLPRHLLLSVIRI